MKSLINKKINLLVFSLFLFFCIITIILFVFDDYSMYKEVDLNKISSYSFWWYISSNSLYMMILYLSPVFISYASITSFSHIYHSNYFSYIVQRIGYKKTIIFEIIKCKINAFILPIVSLVLLFISKIIYNNHIVAPKSEMNGIVFLKLPDSFYEIGEIKFILIYILLLFLISIFFINISIIISKYINNSYMTCLLTLIIVIFLEIIGIFIVGPILAKITGITRVMNVFSVYNLFVLDAIPNLMWEFSYIITLVIASDCIILNNFFLGYGGKK